MSMSLYLVKSALVLLRTITDSNRRGLQRLIAASSQPSKISCSKSCISQKYLFNLCMSKGRSRYVSCELHQNPLWMTQIRNRHSKSSKGRNTRDDDDSDDDDNYIEVADGNVNELEKEVSVPLASLRLDIVLKAGLRISRSKIEEAFYQSRIRINGEKILKKSVQVRIGDEVDIVKGVNVKTDRYLDVMRIQIIALKVPNDPEGRLTAKMYRSKHLTIENYVKEWRGDYMT